LSGGALLLWCSGGVPERALVSGKFYLGRHPSPPQGYSPLSVYAIKPATMEIEAEIPGVFITVSRLHALVAVGGGLVVVRDHGPEGRGSKNGTFVNGKRLERGGSETVRGWAVVGLAASGPRVLVADPEAGVVEVPGGAVAEALQVPECLVGAVGAAGGQLQVRFSPSDEYPGAECIVVARLGWLLAELEQRAVQGYDEDEIKALAERALRIASKARRLRADLIGARLASNLEHALAAASGGVLGVPLSVVREAQKALRLSEERVCGGE
jgi:hypothetical protein